MRYLHDVTFIEETESRYDPNLGEHVDGKRVETKATVNITDLGSNRLVELFGDIKENAIVIRTHPLFNTPIFDYIEYDSKTYKLIKDIYPNDRTTFIVKEFEHGR